LSPTVPEIYSDQRIPEGCSYVRLDGWNFRSLAKKLRLQKPFDPFLAECLVQTSKVFFKTFNPDLAFLFSDEINLLFSRYAAFNRRLEKVDSIFAGLASSILYKFLNRRYSDLPEISFDCRVIPVKGGETLEYLICRQTEARRNCYNAYAQHCLIGKDGLEPKRAAERRKNMKLKDLKRLIRQHGIRMSQIPRWHERGILVYWERFSKEGFDPIRSRKVFAKRRRIHADRCPPRFDTLEGKRLVKKVMRTEE